MKTYIYSFKDQEDIEIEARNRDAADKKFDKKCITEGYSGIYDVSIINENREVEYIQTQATNFVRGK